MNILEKAMTQVQIHNADCVKGAIYLPQMVEIDGKMVAVCWESDKPEVVAAKACGEQGQIPAGMVTRPAKEQKVMLTATFACEGESATKEYPLTVIKKPEEKQYEAYVYTYFLAALKRRGKEVQQVHLAASTDGMFWQDLNDVKPILTSELGTKGVRDTVIFRSYEGDRFYLLGTDLDANEGKWEEYGNFGSPYIIIWESEDLVNWSEPRMIKIGFENSACTWAPRAFYDVKTHEYIVYWSSEERPADWKPRNLKKGEKPPKPTFEQLYKRPGKQIYCAKTRDFIHFTKPEVYKAVDRNEKPYNNKLRGYSGPWLSYIDTTVYEYNGTVYRFTKREQDITIFLETSDSFFGDFEMVQQVIAGETGVEGPDIFKLNGEEKWILMMDGYCKKNAKVGYFPLIAESEDDLKHANFRRLQAGEFKMPTGAKHGAIIPITKAEYEAVMAKWGR